MQMLKDVLDFCLFTFCCLAFLVSVARCIRPQIGDRTCLVNLTLPWLPYVQLCILIMQLGQVNKDQSKTAVMDDCLYVPLPVLKRKWHLMF